jgi:hypothetical protein
MVFQRLEFKKLPRADPFVPPIVLKSPDSPVVDDPDAEDSRFPPVSELSIPESPVLDDVGDVDDADEAPDADAVEAMAPLIPAMDAGNPRLLKSPEVDDVDDVVGDASPCSVAGTEETSWDSVVCALLPAEMLVTWPTAAAWPTGPAGSVVAAGAVNGVKVVALAEEPA